MPAIEILARRAVVHDDAFGQKVEHVLIVGFRAIGGEQMIKTPILAYNDNDMFDRRGGPHLLDRVVSARALRLSELFAPEPAAAGAAR